MARVLAFLVPPPPDQARMLTHHYRFLYLFLVCIALSCNPGLLRSADAATHQDDVNGLMAMLQAWGQQGQSTLQWSGTDPCGSKWTGIQCDNSSPQRVTQIGLSGLGLVGTLPEDIKNLASLQSLDLSYNNFNGSLPKGLSQLSHLSFLLLQQNYFTGSIPSEYGQLKNLTYLYLNGNDLTGPLPNELGLLSKLYWLDVAFNRLSGSLPYSSDGQSADNVGLDNLTSAQHFHLNNNSFSGSIPPALCHPGMSLIHLLLDSNKFTGPIPEELGLCSNLLIMKLTNNNLQGSIPSNISQLRNLTELLLGQNSLSSPLPNLSNLTSLLILDISHNSLNEPFPSWVTSMQELTNILMESTTILGPIPASLFALPFLTTIRLSGNRINGSLDLSLATNVLTLISLENNQIASLNLGSFNADPKVLRLQGNEQVCSLIAYQDTYCYTNSSVSTIYQSPITKSCTNVCSNNLAPSPVDECACVLPYKGDLIFRAPLFTTLDNTSHFLELISYIAYNLKIGQSQVYITSARFNSQYQLLVSISIFPNIGTQAWTRDEVIQLSYVLGNQGIHIDIFGPPLFIQEPYSYNVENPSSSGGGLSIAAKLGIGIGGGAVVLIIIVLLAFAFFQKKRADKAEEHQNPFASWPGSDTKDMSGAAPKVQGARYFPYSELKQASNNFSESNEIGSGGYGKVYKGITSTGQQVAIKRARKDSMQGAMQFKNEIELLSRVHHKNVVGLVGFCYEQGEQMLVYEFMAKGDLRDNLLGRGGSRMNWRRRLMIALGSARGLAYLHELVTPPIIHRDIKSTNILLDEKSIAKVADFGLSKVGPIDGDGDQVVETQVKGTLGYLDPEYYMSQQLSEKSDVYSFGVVLLELITARAPIERGKYIVNEVKTAVDKGGLSSVRSLLDPRLRKEELSELGAFVRLALSCVEDHGVDRPSMGEVVKQLEELVGIDYPESGSSTIEPAKNSRKHPYGYESASRDSSMSSFPNSSTNVQQSFGSP